MKKGLALVLATILLLLTVVPAGSAYASGKTSTRDVTGGTIQVGTVSGKPGDTITVSVTITGNPGFAGFTFEVNYPTQLQLTKVAKGSLLKESDSGSLTSNVTKNLINWNDSVNTTGNGEILVLTFKIADSAASGDYAISLSLKDGKASNMVNEAGTPVTFTYQSGRVTVLGAATGSIQVGTATGKAGETVSVPVRINDNPGFAGFTLEVSYSSQIQLTKVAKGTLLKESDSGSLTSNVTKNLINWNDSVNTTGDGEILVLTFKIVDGTADGSYPVNLALKDGKASNFVNEEGAPVPPAFNAGAVTVQNHVHEYVAVVTPSTCTEQGYTTHTCSCGDSYVDTYVPALGHDWNAPTYTWAANNSTVTATRTCKRDASHVETETVNTTSAVTTPATCTAKGKTTYTATFTNAAFATQTKTVENVPALGHNWNAPTYTWAADNSTVTATRTCKNDASHVETETVNTTSAVTAPATCTAKGKTTYTATFTNSAFATQTKTVENVSALGHNWNAPTYTWAADNSTVTATRTCKNDASHVETETVNTTSAVTTPATCTAKGKTTYTATFTNAAFATQTKTVENIPALGHNWNAPTYTWAADNSTVTATRTCKNDASHVETETVNTTSAVTTPATCTAKGKTTYTASFTNSAFATQTKTVENIPSLGHNWNAPTYTWTADNGTVTATRTCKNDASHIETETVNTTSAVTTPATCTAKGKTTYTASFTNSAFATQTKTVENIPALGHTPAAAVKENETAATCTAAGGYDMVVYCSVCGVELSRERTTLDALGHDYELTVWTWTGYTAAVATFACKNDPSHVENVDAAITSVRTEPTPDADGSVVYTAKVTFEATEYTDTKTEVLPALGHEYELTGWTWTDFAAATATFHDKTADRDITVDATITRARTEPTCEAEGSVVYTATVTFEGNEYSDTKTETLPAVGHEWNDPTYVWAEDYSAVTATRTCKNDETHIETETANTTPEIIKEATTEEEGEVKYTATFENAAFEAQTKTVITPKLEPGDGLPCDGGDSCPGKIFTDMPAKGHWAHDAIDWAIVHGITAGTSATTFSPNQGCTRSQVVTFLWRAAGAPEPTTTNNPFKDVKEGTWYYKAVLWASETGVTAGTSATTFSPNETCTRGQIVTFIWRYEGSPEATTDNNPFADVKDGTWYTKAVLWASATGVTAGTSATTFSPNDTCTRAQIVTFLYRDLVG